MNWDAAWEMDWDDETRKQVESFKPPKGRFPFLFVKSDNTAVIVDGEKETVVPLIGFTFIGGATKGAT